MVCLQLLSLLRRHLMMLFSFCGEKSPFCGATGTISFELQLTLPIGSKARVDKPSPVHFSLWLDQGMNQQPLTTEQAWYHCATPTSFGT